MTRDRCPHCGSKWIDVYAYASRCHACGGVWANSEPPADGKEYGCVWVEKKRDAEGKRTCIGCHIMQHCPDESDVLTPGPGCPLGSDDAPTPDAPTKAQVERIKKAQRLAKEQEIPFREALKRIDDAPTVRT